MKNPVLMQHRPMQVLLLENVRFHKQEEQNDPEFAKQVRKLHIASLPYALQSTAYACILLAVTTSQEGEKAPESQHSYLLLSCECESVCA